MIVIADFNMLHEAFAIADFNMLHNALVIADLNMLHNALAIADFNMLHNAISWDVARCFARLVSIRCAGGKSVSTQIAATNAD